MKSFLENRTQRVVIDGHSSGTVLVRSCVVQGSVLGPLLFVLFVDDIVDLLGTTMGTKLYAYDLKLYTRVRMDEPGSLADALTRLEEWSVKWQLGINECKCSVMHMGNGALDTPYNINQIQLPSVDKVCMWSRRHLRQQTQFWRSYRICCVKSVSTNIFDLPEFCFSKKVEPLMRAYITYVRPLLEYCTPVWSPHLIKKTLKKSKTCSDTSRVGYFRRTKMATLIDWRSSALKHSNYPIQPFQYS